MLHNFPPPPPHFIPNRKRIHGLPTRSAVLIVADHEMASSNPEPDIRISTSNVSRKRKLSDSGGERVEWSDDSESFQRLKKTKRRSVGRPRKKGKEKETRAKGKRRATVSVDWIKDLDETSPQDDNELDDEIPAYIRRRRKDFDHGRQTLKDAGLRIPPDYSDIYFSDDERMAKLAERPVFGDAIKPCRPYQDVELEYSAGLIPASIAQYLRDYQIVGAKFLHQLFVYQKGGVLGDDMGLGKTIQVIAFLAAAFGKTGDERDAKRMRKMRRHGEVEDIDVWYPRVLIICPGSVTQNWKNELERWGWWSVDIFLRSTKDEVLHAAKSGRLEIMITTYGTYRDNRQKINTVPWDAVVADECHIMKERLAMTTQAMNEVNALCRIGLTGTAIQNKYEELWTLLNWTNPGHFGTLREWRQTICVPLTVGQSHDATLFQLSRARKTAKKLVQNLLPQFFLRRMKSLIAHQLPKKTDKVVFCPLTDIQQEAYENFIASDDVQIIKHVSDPCSCLSGKKRGWCCDTYLTDDTKWQTKVFPFITTLMKLSGHLTLLVPSENDRPEKRDSELNMLRKCLPDDWEDIYKQRQSLLTLSNPEFCGKWKILRKLLRFWHENGDKVLVFSHSVRLLYILQLLFRNTSYSVSYLDGSLSYEERQQVVDDFNSDPNQFVFLISTRAGGVGLNITSANKVVIMDPHWNPSHDLQAQDRAYRIGQTRDVDVFRLISAGTIEEIVYARQIYKQQQANIGYNASNERRYFKGVQQDRQRKGEIFGLDNLFAYRANQVMLREIVNKTNIAEAKAGVNLADFDIEKAAKDESDPLNFIKKEDNEDDERDLKQMAAFLAAEDQEAALQAQSGPRLKTDAVQAILTSAGVEYTHENSEVIGSSRVEAQLSRRAELAAADSDDEGGDGAAAAAAGHGNDNNDGNNIDGHSALFADEQANSVPASRVFFYNPPPEVLKRQFCSMAREFGFASATEFALVVESWTQEQRRNCLETFYKIRESKLAGGKVKSADSEVGEEENKRGAEEKIEEDTKDVKIKMESQGPMVFRDDEETEDDDGGEEVNDEDMNKKVKAEGGQDLATGGDRKSIRLDVYDDDDETDEL